MADETTLKLNLLNFLEKKGAYSASGQVRLPGGHWADLAEFLPHSGVGQEQLEELVQKMRQSWEMAAFWLDGQWMAFYTLLGHQELNRLRGHDSAPPSEMEMGAFWLALEHGLEQQGLGPQARLVSELRRHPEVVQTSQLVWRQLTGN